MSLRLKIQSSCREIGRANQASQIGAIYSLPFLFDSLQIKENWFEAIQSIRDLSESEWTSMKLPVRLYTVLMNFDETSNPGIIASEIPKSNFI